jgi:hypothetical protein
LEDTGTVCSTHILVRRYGKVRRKSKGIIGKGKNVKS